MVDMPAVFDKIGPGRQLVSRSCGCVVDMPAVFDKIGMGWCPVARPCGCVVDMLAVFDKIGVGWRLVARPCGCVVDMWADLNKIGKWFRVFRSNRGFRLSGKPKWSVSARRFVSVAGAELGAAGARHRPRVTRNR